MRMVDLIEKKRDNKELEEQEIRYMIENYVKKEIPDYQMSAFLMAVFFRGMSKKETLYLTQAMAESGDRMDLSAIKGIKVDKHSTGGVGDKTTLILGPLTAALGLPVAKMSGRGLGHTGGTIDKLESIPGFSTGLSPEEFICNVKETGIALAGQSADLAVADKMIYALRDVTATVNSMPLIASSIMSKKLASGADAIVLDVKVGKGAFMQTMEDAEELAREMVELGNMAGRKTMAVLSDMNQPLGNTVGNLLEVMEAVETLQGKGPEDLTGLCIELGACMLMAGEIAETEEEAKKRLNQALSDGSAYEKFLELVERQGGKKETVKDLEKQLNATVIKEVISQQSGYVEGLDAWIVGKVSLVLGAGRETKESQIDYSAGIRLMKKTGSYVNKGDVLAVLYTNDEKRFEEGEKLLKQAYTFSNERKEEPELIKKKIM